MRAVRSIFVVLALWLAGAAGGFEARAAVWQAAAAPSVLQFEETSFDFGDIREDGGRVTHTFRFRNGGTVPVVVLEAHSTCGCTVPAFSRKPVMPSESGSIEVTFDPMNRPGRIEKRIAVVTSEGGEPVRLWIRGNVVPREKGIDELYPAYMGSGIRAETTFHSFAYIERGKGARTGFGLVNTSERRVEVSLLNTSPRPLYTIEGVTFPVVLEPRERCELTIAADPGEADDRYGTVTEHLALEIDGRRSDVGVVVTGIVIDSRERADNLAPGIAANKNIVKFGVVNHDAERVTESVVIANRGTAPLRIRAVEGCAEGTAIALAAGDVIGAGESRSVEVAVQPCTKEYGAVVERLRLITNDPARPVFELKVTMIAE